ncbi:MAG: GGDEF domain-containing protein [Pseudonocardiaceae bacterium]
MGILREESGAQQIDLKAVAVPVSAVRNGSAVVNDKDHSGLALLHESLAALLASRGQWREAYEHLRSALDLSRDPADAAEFPEVLRLELDRLRREYAEAREQSLRDSLTASYNRRYLDQRLHDLLIVKPVGTGLALALVDLDFFKQVNDTHGHHLGDQVLRRVVEVLQDGLPDGAFCARYGGEEFVLVLPDVGPAAAVVICEAARARVERHPWAQLAAGLRVTVSIGVAHHGSRAQVNPEQRIKGVPELLLSADHLLYQAKQAGRNAVAFRSADSVALAGMAAHRRGGPAE